MEKCLCDACRSSRVDCCLVVENGGWESFGNLPRVVSHHTALGARPSSRRRTHAGNENLRAVQGQENFDAVENFRWGLPAKIETCLYSSFNQTSIAHACAPADHGAPKFAYCHRYRYENHDC